METTKQNNGWYWYHYRLVYNMVTALWLHMLTCLCKSTILLPTSSESVDIFLPHKQNNYMQQRHALICNKQEGLLPVEASMALTNGFTSKEKFGINQMGFHQQKGLVWQQMCSTSQKELFHSQRLQSLEACITNHISSTPHREVCNHAQPISNKYPLFILKIIIIRILVDFEVLPELCKIAYGYFGTTQNRSRTIIVRQNKQFQSNYGNLRQRMCLKAF